MHFALHLLSLAQVRLGRAPLEGIVPQLDDVLPLTDRLVALVQSRLALVHLPVPLVEGPLAEEHAPGKHPGEIVWV